MSPLQNIEFITLFDDINFLGKVTSVISKVSSDLNIEKYIDFQQLIDHNFSNKNKKYILVSNNESLSKLTNFINEQGIFENIISIDSEEPSLDFEIIHINKKLILTGLMTRVNELLKNHFSEDDYFPTHYNNLVIGKTYPCGFYLKLSEKKFIKVLSENEIIESDFINKYIEKEIEYFYIPFSEYDNFTKYFFRQKTVFKKREEQVSASIDSIEALHTYVKDLGISDRVINQTKQLHDEITKNADSKIIKRLLGKLKGLEGSYLYNHSYVTATIALTAGKKFNWFTFENQEKVYMGSMLHNLGYENESNALNEKMSKEEILKLPKEQQDDILNHCTKYAEQLATVPTIHQDVINIILRHHGVHGEDSYPKSTNPNKVTLIFALFIISHDFTTSLYDIDFDKSQIPSVINGLKERYTVGNYKSVLPEFISSVDETFLTN